MPLCNEVLYFEVCVMWDDLHKGCPNSVLEGRCPAEFSSNPN